MKLLDRFEAWMNKPVSMPSWFGYLMMAVLASFLTSFMLTNVFKSVGVAQQLIEIRGLVHGIEQTINPMNVRLTEIEKKLNKMNKKWWQQWMKK